jgi:integrase/recombinase XerD
MTKLVPFSAVKPEAWPPLFRRLLKLRHALAQPLESPNVASEWRATTYNFHVWNLGFFLGWLAWSDRFDAAIEFQDYVTPEIVSNYVDDMRGYKLSARTIANRVDGVRAALAALSPEQPADWLMHGIKKLRTEPSDRRRTGERAQHTASLVDLGMELMNRAADPDFQRADVGKAVLFRDGLMIVFLALAVPRLSPLQVMALGQHLVAHDGVFKISWSAEEMKEGKAYSAVLDQALSELFHRYLDEFRPILLARATGKGQQSQTAVWLGIRGGQLSREGIYAAIKTRTRAAFDEPMFPHGFRHSAATSLALERPDLIRLATPHLQHQAECSRELYIHADEIAASRKFGHTLNGRRFRRGRRRPASGAESTDAI